MSSLLFALLAVVPVAPPPPTVITVPVAPPVPASYAPRLMAGAAMAATEFDVEIRGGTEILWSGPMRVAGNYPATFSRQKMDAPPGECAASSFGYGGGQRSSLTVNLTAYRADAVDGRFQLQVNWERPGADAGCGAGRNMRTVGLAESFDLQPGQSRALAGDGGLVVRLHRR